MQKVAVVMGSSSDWPTMQQVATQLTALAIPFEKHVISAHRMPDKLSEFGKHAADQGFGVIIAGAGGAAHLPGMLAANTLLPVIGVPIKTRTLNGVDSLLSIVQMPGGVPVGTMAIGDAGAMNAALFAASILALTDEALTQRLEAFRAEQTKRAEESEAALK
ncbi:5-(carboxyamino)imidazole ribonucleotide mutase [Lacticaseibacillus chiayiensis]|uniref:N5-carboxyaminoimidazole ribonucleotide mutase n=1 Tax=Lacticaseibacillus chiayiensis TaxID=2100821 RepID=A0A4Q1UCA6_9LACO|nr:5-(carboxyamino)imidazole ribonucleotide mutase [Lacticaseibacillus chiayiensis]QVI33728.1 5-(carboxyamino)imidazole ribonucleotide mutase [Lacticaseibacillus chiayiensis]RXT29662.1 5-(carboxyamino)imidazole ribonucleotide mutase [Lacticaseibacillus chiayiensis]RXT59309.1 5-(carboxyamino)imidazole ribonucleotide mutase [Lacticaseibacillus chiayiensis]UYN55473.1 5-(carboxyamino)imidazole ribonucleotide mutase [Lacticaseibacillus chiayiensis]